MNAENQNDRSGIVRQLDLWRACAERLKRPLLWNGRCKGHVSFMECVNGLEIKP